MMQLVLYLADGKGEKVGDTLPGEVDVAHFQVGRGHPARGG